MTVQKTKTKVINPTNHNSSKQRDEPIRIPAITSNLLKSRVQGATGSFGFASHWLKNWRVSFLSQSLSVAIAIAW